jgi:hypothetical protein
MAKGRIVINIFSKYVIGMSALFFLNASAQAAVVYDNFGLSIHAVRSERNFDDHVRRRHCGRANPETKRSGSAGHHTPAVKRQMASRKVNVESAPENGHFAVSYINRHLTATIDPDATFSTW